MNVDKNLFFEPPVLFAGLALGVAVLHFLFSRMGKKRKVRLDGGESPYACGESGINNMIQPDYSQFFPFAFFFTVLHVVVLMIATVPGTVGPAIWMAVLYVLVALVSLFILLRKD